MIKPMSLKNPLWICALVTVTLTAQDNTSRLNRHQVTNAKSPVQQPGAEQHRIPSLIEGLKTKDDWYKTRRPEIPPALDHPPGQTKAEQRPIRSISVTSPKPSSAKSRSSPGYTRILLDLPMETDFLQPHVLLLPKVPAQASATLPSSAGPRLRLTTRCPNNGGASGWPSAGTSCSPAGRLFAITAAAPLKCGPVQQSQPSRALRTLAARLLEWSTMPQREAEYLRSLPDVDPVIASASSAFR